MTKQKKKADLTPKATKEKAVVAQPSTDKEVIHIAEEVDTLSQTRRSIKPSIRKKLQQLIGKTLQDAQAELDALIAAGEVGSFRVLQKGQMYTGDFEADRVQVFATGDQITDLEVG